MIPIYSRSYGSIESDQTKRGFTVPPDYNGSMYAEQKQPVYQAPEPEKHENLPPPPIQEPEPVRQPVSPPETNPPAKSTGLLGGLLDKISVEDLVMFGLVLALLLGDSSDNIPLLAIILAVILT